MGRRPKRPPPPARSLDSAFTAGAMKKEPRCATSVGLRVTPDYLARCYMALESSTEERPETVRNIIIKSLDAFVEGIPPLKQRDAIAYLHQRNVPLRTLLLDSLTPKEKEHILIQKYLSIYADPTPEQKVAKHTARPLERDLDFYAKLYGVPPEPLMPEVKP